MASDSLRPHGLEPTGLLFPWDSQAGIPEWVAISSSRSFSWPRGQTCIFSISYTDRQFLYHCNTLEGHVTLYSAKSLPLPASLMALLVKYPSAMQDTWALSPGVGNGYPFQYSGLENSMECMVHAGHKTGHDWVTFTSLHFTSYPTADEHCLTA